MVDCTSVCMTAVRRTRKARYRNSMTILREWVLKNPDGKFVKSARILEVDTGGGNILYNASVTTRYSRYGSNTDVFKTLMGAKQTIGRNFMPGGKWELVNKQETRIDGRKL